jgi:integrase
LVLTTITSLKGLKIQVHEQLLAKLLFVETQCINPQDALVIRLLIEGFEIHEIVYLKKESIDTDYRAITFNDGYGNQKQYPISTRCAQLFMSAINQTHYISNNGFDHSKIIKTELRDSNYVIKVGTSDYLAHADNPQEMDSIVLKTIYNRLRTLAEIYNIPEITFVTTVRVKSNQTI